MSLKPIPILSLTMLAAIATPSYAVSQIPLPTAPLYYKPEVVKPTAAIEQQSCAALDSAISDLQPYRYSYKPNYYKDGFNKLAAGLATIDSVPVVGSWAGLSFLGYSALIDEKETRRMLMVEKKVSMLQRVKAEKHCFE